MKVLALSLSIFFGTVIIFGGLYTGITLLVRSDGLSEPEPASPTPLPTTEGMERKVELPPEQVKEVMVKPQVPEEGSLQTQDAPTTLSNSAPPATVTLPAATAARNSAIKSQPARRTKRTHADPSPRSQADLRVWRERQMERRHSLGENNRPAALRTQRPTIRFFDGW